MKASFTWNLDMLIEMGLVTKFKYFVSTWLSYINSPRPKTMRLRSFTLYHPLSNYVKKSLCNVDWITVELISLVTPRSYTLTTDLEKQ